MSPLEAPFSCTQTTFATTVASELSAELIETLNWLHEEQTQLWEQMIRCQEAKAVMVLHIGGYRTTQTTVLRLLQCAHGLGVPVLLVPFQEEEADV